MVSTSGTRVSLLPADRRLDNPADEDGVRFEGVFAVGVATPITVTASGYGLLDAWVDWNNNGRFDSDEQVFANQPVLTGENRLTITTPLSVDETQIPFYTYTRFRLSQGGGLAAYGLSVGGEVEDYRLRIMTNTPPELLVSPAIPAPPALPPLPTSISALEDNASNQSSQYDLSQNFFDLDQTNGNGDFPTYTVTLNGFATAVTDLGTQGAVHVRLEAVQSGLAGNQIVVAVTDSDHGDASGPSVSVRGSRITVDLNTNAANPTTAKQWVDAINLDLQAKLLVSAAILRGNPAQDLTQGGLGTYAPIQLATTLPVAYQLQGAQLTLQFLQDRNGKGELVVTATDQAFASVSKTVTITVAPVNDPPTFTPGTNPIVVYEDAGLQVRDSWATQMLAGPPTAVDESIQALNFIVTFLPPPAPPVPLPPFFPRTLTAADFIVQPTINATTGQLSFQVAANKNGIAYLKLELHDDGDTTNGGNATSTPSTLTITVDPINDPPVLTVPLVVQSVYEHAPVRPDNQLKFGTVGKRITAADVDLAEQSSTAQMAVTLTATHGVLTVTPPSPLGTFVFTTGDGTLDATLSFQGTQVEVQAVLDSLTFIPTDYYYGPADLTVTVNDQGHTGYDPDNLTQWSTGQDVTRVVTIAVLAVNDPPTVDLSGVTTKTVLEDTNLPLGRIVVGDPLDAPSVPTLQVTLRAQFGKLTVRIDVPTGLTAGSVVGNGTREVVLTATPALINTTLANATGLVYRGDQDFNNWRGQEVITVLVDDQGSYGQGVPTTPSDSFSISVTPVNDAPLLQAPTSLTLNEDDPNYYIPIKVTDVDADEAPVDPKQAVTVRLRLTDASGITPVTVAGKLWVDTTIPNGINLTNGLLVGNGTPDVTLSGSPVKISTTLLDAKGLHFVPTPNYNGSLYLVVTVEDHGNTGPNSPSNPGASLKDSQTIPLTILAVNDAPVLALEVILSDPAAYTEKGDPARLFTNQTQMITVSDVDNTTLRSATVQITPDSYHSGEDLLEASRGTWNAATGTLTLTGTDTVLNYQAFLQSMTYRNTSSNPSSAPRTVTFTVNDGSLNSNVQTRAITVTPVNDPPAFTLIETENLKYTEAEAAKPVTSTLILSDPDSTQLVGGTVQFQLSPPNYYYFPLEDVLSFVDTATIKGIWTAASGTLTLSGPDTLANYQAAFRRVLYHNTSNNPNTLPRQVTFTANDGSASNAPPTATRRITVVNDDTPPVLAGIESGPKTYTEKEELITPLTPITQTITVSDVDNTTLRSATVQITPDSYHSGEDLLEASRGTWNAAAGTLTLTGTDIVLNYEKFLRSVTYRNTSLNPSSAPRIVSFQVNDGTADSNLLSRTISVTPVNDPPVLAGMETATLPYQEKDPATVITSSLTATDPDNTTLSYATVQIATGYQSGEDLLAFADSFGITGSWDATGGTLTLSGSSSRVSLVNYQRALRLVKYENLSSNPSEAQRTVTFTVNDGSLSSNVQTRKITVKAVNDPPVLAGIQGTFVYVQQDPAIAISAAASVSDVDNATLGSATVQITADSYHSGEDLLEASRGTWYPTTGTLTLTGTDTLANYQAFLQSVTYRNTSSNPSSQTRTVTFTINDGSLSSLPPSTVTITVSRLNSPPVAGPDRYSTKADQVLQVAAPGLLVNDSDPEGSAVTVVAQTLISVKGASVQLFANGTLTYDPRQSLTLQSLAVGATTEDTFTYQVTDNAYPRSGIGTGTVTVIVTGVPRYRNPNPARYADVTGDGYTSPIDVLVLINYINSYPNKTTPLPLPPEGPIPPYLDPTGDGNCMSDDVLYVITVLNTPPGLGGEGEAALVNSPASGSSALPDTAGFGVASAASWNGVSAASAPQAGLTSLPFGPLLVQNVSAVSQDTAVPVASLKRLSAVALAKPQTSSAFDDWSTDAWDGDESLTQITDGLHHVRGTETSVDEVFRSL
ncbi:MAG: Ig-like domain-containing protein [Planctomycetota bacterium]|nr:Ig-like domain-containing protein [Planctomycetota bacterium]